MENVNDTLLLVDSHAKTLKEKSMHGKASSRFEEGLKAIQKGIMTKAERRSVTRSMNALAD